MERQIAAWVGLSVSDLHQAYRLNSSKRTRGQCVKIISRLTGNVIASCWVSPRGVTGQLFGV
jgi:hypothetical protein